MTKETCKTCSAYLETQRGVGMCRARPPTPIMVGMGEPAIVMGMRQPPMPVINSYFPPMMEDGWCREWRRNYGSLQKTSIEVTTD